jgi:CO/xanthine dehydrogenase Mo-binding subunit
LGAISQIEGGVHMGLGFAMYEEIVLDEVGRMRNNYLLDYRIPTALDMPPVSSILVETDDPLCPYGAKGVGEMATIGTAESLIAAVYDAVGVWIPDLPITPEKILMALKKKKSEEKEG